MKHVKRKWLALAAAAAAGAVLLPSSATGVALITRVQAARPDVTVNRGVIRPTASQLQLVRTLGAHATWSRYGTPASLLRFDGGYLASGLGGDAVTAARSFLDANKALFRLSGADGLQLVNDVTLRGTDAHAVLFAQKFGDLVADWDGLIAVGVVGGKIAYVSSSASGASQVAGSVKLSATDAWAAAARNVGVPTGAFGAQTQKDGWTYFDVSGLTRSGPRVKNDTVLPLPPLPPLPPLTGGGTVPKPPTGGTTGTTVLRDSNAVLAQLQATIGSLLGGQATSATSLPVDVGVHQGAKLVAFPTLKSGVRPAWLVNVVDLRSAAPQAYQLMVDADNGAILFRHDAVQELGQGGSQPAYSFTGDYGPPPACGPVHSFAVDSGEKAVAAAASAINPTNDIILKLLDPSGNVVGSSDTATSPEAVLYQDPSGGDLAVGNWGLQVCPFTGPSLQPPLPNQTPPYTYVAAAAVTSVSAVLPTLPRPKPPTLVTNNPRWAFFPSFPGLDYAATPQSEGCWENKDDGIAQPKPCAATFASPASPFGWDVIPRTNQATLTTRGNNAFTAEAWLSPLTPAENRTPVSGDRYYDRNFPGGNFVWTNAWNRSKCDPAVLADPTRNNGDVDAATTNLFVMHNRMHDFAYGLGFTEQTYNAQLDNLDHGDKSTGPYPYGREGDPELGNTQAGAVTGGQPSLEGRDNANQITLNDGTPPITNQYLWQPLASAFYAPCTDGSFDLSVAGHEYTHLISNRMVGGPDASLSSFQGQAMGESWSDLDALEYLHEQGFAGKMGEDPWSLGAYVTGNKHRGIRDYALDENPLNYSDIGFDTTGPEVHADGEIWNGVNFEVRSALVSKYGQAGGRRWIQLVYDAWLLEQADLSMVDARDAMLAADLMRYGGADETELWRAFAHRGLGVSASSDTGEDDQPTPGFDSPLQANATVSFVTVAKDGADAGAPVKAKVFVGDYEARVTPVADTAPASDLGNTARFVPGAYDFVVQAPGYGLVRFSHTFAAGATTLTIALPTNWASTANDASAAGDGANLDGLIDDTEATNWESTGSAVAGKQVTVDLSGRHVITAARVSALNHPASTAQNRFSALRSFKLEACDASVRNCALAKNWVTAYDSAPDAFPAVRPRPVAPDVNLRTFDVKDVAATKVRLVVKTNQCTGGPDFQGDQDNDPSNNSDCATSANAQNVRAAELEIVSTTPTITESAGTTATAASPASGGTASPAASSASASASPAAAAKPVVTVVGTPQAGVAGATKALRARRATFGYLAADGAIRALQAHARATFSLRVTAAKGGFVRYVDGSRGLRLRSTRISTVLVDYRRHTARVTGSGIAGGRAVRFTLLLTDSGHADAFAIRLSTGYRLGGRLVGGSVTIA